MLEERLNSLDFLAVHALLLFVELRMDGANQYLCIAKSRQRTGRIADSATRAHQSKMGTSEQM